MPRTNSTRAVAARLSNAVMVGSRITKESVGGSVTQHIPGALLIRAQHMRSLRPQVTGKFCVIVL